MITTLPTRPLGRSGLPITRVGFGAWAIGGGGWSFGWGPQDDAASLATMRHALERGVNWIDTAAVYGLGHSEELVGRLLRELPRAQRPLVFTKCGLVWDEQDPMASRAGRCSRTRSAASARRRCAGSASSASICTSSTGRTRPARRRGLVGSAWRAWSSEGKVRAAGVSNFDVAAARALRGDPPRRLAAAALLADPPRGRRARDPVVRAHETGVIVYSPMQSGLLTDSFTPSASPRSPPTTGAARSPEFQAPSSRRNLALRDALRPIAARHGTSSSPSPSPGRSPGPA